MGGSAGRCSTGSAWLNHPGPLIMVVQFVGFLMAYRHPGYCHRCSPAPSAACSRRGALLCRAFCGSGSARRSSKLRDNKPLNGALAGITAAVVGVILNLAIWFALHTWFHHATQFRGLVSHSTCRW